MTVEDELEIFKEARSMVFNLNGLVDICSAIRSIIMIIKEIVMGFISIIKKLKPFKKWQQ